MQAGVAFNLIGAVFNQGSTFAINIVVANLLGAEAFGGYTMVQTTLAAMVSLSQFAMGYTATKYVAEFRSRDTEKTGRILGLCAAVSLSAGSVVALALLGGASWLAADVLEAAHLAPGLMLVAGAVFFNVVNGFQMGALAGLEAYPSLAKAGVASGSLYFVLCAVMARYGGLNGALAGLTTSALVQCAILSVFLRREIARQGVVMRFRGAWQERGIVTGFALPASLSGLVTLPALWLASAFLARQPGGYLQLALFGAASNFRTAVLFLPQTVNNVGMSLLNNQRGTDEDAYRRVFWMNVGMTGLSVVAGATVVMLAGPWLLRVFGPEFGGGSRALTILMGAAVLEALGLATFQIVQSHGRIWLSLVAIVLPRDLGVALFAALLVGRYGAAGLATAHGLGWIIGLAAMIIVVRRIGLSAT